MVSYEGSVSYLCAAKLRILLAQPCRILTKEYYKRRILLFFKIFDLVALTSLWKTIKGFALAWRKFNNKQRTACSCHTSNVKMDRPEQPANTSAEVEPSPPSAAGNRAYMGLEEVNPLGSGEQWIRPSAPIASEVYGLRSFFAEIEGLEVPPREGSIKLMPGFDGCVLVRGSPVRFEKALTGYNVLCCVHPYFAQKKVWLLQG